MKKTVGITIILISVAIVVTAIGFWRQHYLTVKNAEPEKVYKYTPSQQDKSTKETSLKQKNLKKKKADKGIPSQSDNISKEKSIESDDKTDVEMEALETTQPNDNNLTPEETENTSNPSVHHIFSDIVVENLPPKAAAALKEYDEIQLAIPELNDELKPIMEARPIDFEAIGVIIEKQRELRERRKDTLEILSKYSEEASNELEATIKREKAAKIVVEEMVEEPDMDADDAKRRMEELTK